MSKSKSFQAQESGAEPAAAMTPQERESLIQQAAYFHAERRGFSGGAAVEDWLAAEREVDVSLARPGPGQAYSPEA